MCLSAVVEVFDVVGTQEVVASDQVEHAAAVVHHQPGQLEMVVNLPTLVRPRTDVGPAVLWEVG